MKVTFVNDPHMYPVGLGNDWALDADFHARIEDDDGEDAPVVVTVPKGFSTDLASVPRLPLVHWMFAGRARRAVYFARLVV